jgi:hypothetical protein
MGLYAQRMTNDIIFIWGKRHAQIFSVTGSVCSSMVIVGYPDDHQLPRYLSNASLLRRKFESMFEARRIICFYDNPLTKDDEDSYSEGIEYVNNLLKWISMQQNTLLVMKTKRKDIVDEYPDFIKSMLKDLEARKKIVYETDRGDLAPGFASDIVLGIGFGTLPCLLGTYGKDVVLFDGKNYHERWPIGASRIRLINRPSDITACLDRFFQEPERSERDYSSIRPEPSLLDSFSDGRSAERITAYMTSLFNGIREGLGASEAIRAANSSYEKLWGQDKIIDMGCVREAA